MGKNKVERKWKCQYCHDIITQFYKPDKCKYCGYGLFKFYGAKVVKN